jgi:[histone H3]-trimethyl-L-lysine4 demethylase
MLLCDGCDRGYVMLAWPMAAPCAGRSRASYVGRYHMDCLTPPVQTVPKGAWYCPQCHVPPEPDFGFEEGRRHTLASFRAMADKFKRAWFGRGGADAALSANASPSAEDTITVTPAAAVAPIPSAEDVRGWDVSEDDVEREFWRLVASPSEHVEVEYGADVHTSSHGRCVCHTQRTTRGQSWGHALLLWWVRVG